MLPAYRKTLLLRAQLVVVEPEMQAHAHSTTAKSPTFSSFESFKRYPYVAEFIDDYLMHHLNLVWLGTKSAF